MECALIRLTFSCNQWSGWTLPVVPYCALNRLPSSTFFIFLCGLLSCALTGGLCGEFVVAICGLISQ